MALNGLETFLQSEIAIFFILFKNKTCLKSLPALRFHYLLALTLGALFNGSNELVKFLRIGRGRRSVYFAAERVSLERV